MKEYKTDEIRNIVLLGHGSAGKTSLSEAMLYQTGATNRMGKVEEGTTVADFDEEEIRRTISLSLSMVPCEWKNVKLNTLDTPGYTDFVGEVISAIHVADLGLVVVDAVSGVDSARPDVFIQMNILGLDPGDEGLPGSGTGLAP